MKTNVTIMVCIVIAVLTAGSASAWIEGYQYRQPITLTGGTSGAQSDDQMNFTVAYDSDMQPDFDDLRFTKLDGDTLLDAWLESKTNGVSANVIVETDTPADAVEANIYMYYGNASAGSNWDIGNTYLLGDDFGDGDYTTNPPWTVFSGSWTAASYQLTPDESTSAHRIIRSEFSTSDSYVLEFKGLQWVTFHVQDENNLYALFGTTGKLYKRVGGGWTELNVFTARFNTNKNSIIIEVSGATTTVHFGGETHADSTYNSGYIGFNGQTPADWADDVRVRKYVAYPATYIFGSETSDPSYLPPSINSTYNNITGTRSHIPLDYGTAVLFNATASEVDTWTWTIDGVDQGPSTNSFAHTFTNGFGYHAVTVNASNSLGSDTFTWGIWEKIETTAETIPTFTDTSYQMLLSSIDYPPDMEEFGKAMAHPFVQMVGAIFYLFIFGIPLLMMYIRQDNMTLPTTLLLLFGSIIIFMLPPQWQIIAGALMTLGFVGILFKLYKERER